MKKMIACLLTLALALTAVARWPKAPDLWWGGDARHALTTNRPSRLSRPATGIDVQMHLQRVGGWERQDEPVFRL